MNNAYSRLAGALVVSLLLHAAVIATGMQGLKRVEPAQLPSPPELKVSLREQLLPDSSPRLLLPPAPPQNASAVAAVSAPRPQPASPQALQGLSARTVAEQLQRALLYPPEAIARGLEGEAQVMLFLDESGTVIAARLEVSSGHELLDDAAVRAARSLRSLPASAPREALLPVRFRLR